MPQVETGASFDARRGLVPAAPAAASAAQLAAIDELRAATVELAVEIDSVTGATRKMQDYGGFLTPPDTARDAAVVGRSWVAGHANLLGLDAADLVGARESSLLRHEASGTTNLILQQTHAGLEVYNGLLHVNLDRQGRIVSVNNLFLPRLATALNTTSPELDATAAIHAAAGHLGRRRAPSRTSKPRAIRRPIAASPLPRSRSRRSMHGSRSCRSAPERRGWCGTSRSRAATRCTGTT